MNDKPTAQSVNDLPQQSSAQSATDPMSNFNLGANPPGQPGKSSATDGGGKALIDNTQKIDHGNSDTPQDGSGVKDDELESIRRDALNQLSPLLGKLDQPPEEKYRTLMMMIQASDNKTLLKEAYEAASQIEDDTKKAEALLGIINEINYFSKEELPSQTEA